MNNTTVTLFVTPNSLIPLCHSLRALDKLGVDNTYTLQTRDIKYKMGEASNWTRVNVPIDLYLKFRNCYNRSKKIN